MQQLLQGKKTIVTGGTRGIGRAISKAFVEAGASVALFGTNAEKGQEVLNELKPLLKGDQQVTFHQVDISSAEQVEAGIQKVLTDFGQIDVLVNNAGITRDGLLMRSSEEDWDKVLETNLKSIFYTCKQVIRPMMKARQGKIINITSVVGLIGNGGQTNYAASKAGMIGFSKSLAKEMGSRGICVNCVAPGFIQTDMTDALNETQKQQLMTQIPLQRLGQPQEIAAAVLFLASPLADYITGQVLTVDGGMVMS